MIALGKQFLQQANVLRVAFCKPVAGMQITRLLAAAILAEVIETDDIVAVVKQLLNQISAYKARGASN